MMLLTVVLAPLSLAVLLIVMSWTERALDHQPTGRVIPTTLGAESQSSTVVRRQPE